MISSRGLRGNGPGNDIGLLLLRIGPGIVFTVHGYLKLFGGHFDRTVALFMTIDFPAPEPLTWIVGILELVGGLLVAAGLWTRLIGALLAMEMVVAIIRVRWVQGFVGAAEFEVILLLSCLALIATGAGRFSVEALWRGRPRKSRRRK